MASLLTLGIAHASMALLSLNRSLDHTPRTERNCSFRDNFVILTFLSVYLQPNI
jgi:hypothetical protein